MEKTERPVMVSLQGEDGTIYNATVLFHGPNYYSHIHELGAKGHLVNDSADTRLAYEEFLEWKRIRKTKTK